MSAPEIFRIGDDRLLCDHWQARTGTVVLRPADPHRGVDPETIVSVVDELAQRGVDRVLTAALDDAGLAPFITAGFSLHEALCVLRHDLASPSPARPDRTNHVRTLRASKRRDLDVAALVDERAFASGTALDVGGLRAILSATPDCRFRVVNDPTTLRTAAYAISGRAGDCGYVQRVAVDPDCRRHGNGRALMTDALGWFRRRRVAHVLVNTQVANVAARRLYLDVGFVPTSQRLAVWAWHREGPR